MILLKHQEEFVESQIKRTTILSTGTGAGKTTACMELIKRNQDKKMFLISNVLNAFFELPKEERKNVTNFSIIFFSQNLDYLFKQVKKADMVIVDGYFDKLSAAHYTKDDKGEFTTVTDYEVLKILQCCAKRLCIAGTFSPLSWLVIKEFFNSDNSNIIYARTRDNHHLPQSFADVLDFKAKSDPTTNANGIMTSPLPWQTEGNNAFYDLLIKYHYTNPFGGDSNAS